MMHDETSKPVDALSEFAHELNNILMTIGGYADVVIAEHPDEPFVDDLNEIRSAVKRAARLTRQLTSTPERFVTPMACGDGRPQAAAPRPHQ